MGLIETFLFDKLANAIENPKPSPHSPYLSPLKEKCTDLKGLIGKTNNPKVRENLYRLNNEFLLLKNCHHYSSIETRRCSSVKTLSETLNEIKNDLSQNTTSHHHDDDDSCIDTYRWSTRLADPTAKIPGFEDRAMERMLVDDQRFEWIGIFGMAGVGKTTLGQVSFGNGKVRGHFFPRIWVCMTGQPKEDEVARRMLTCLGFEDEYVDRLGGRAVEQQLKGKKCLIVLDNVDEVSLLLLPSWLRDHKKVIVTSRSENAAGGIFGKKNLHELLAVVDKERCCEIFMGEAEKDGCWEKFMGEAKKRYGKEGKMDGDGIEDEKIKNKKMKDEIVESCNGLPLVAKMKGQILRMHEEYRSK